MSIFNKTKEYRIVTNRNLVGVVREFAEKHRAEDCEIDIHVQGSLLKENYLVTIAIKSTEKKKAMHDALREAFEANYDLNIRRKLIFVFEKEKEEES